MKTKSQKAPLFYHYSQNNSGGNFGGPAVHVFVEANTGLESDLKAEDVGLYFDGCESGVDCECCGDRWSRAWGGNEAPLVYGKPLDAPRDETDWSTEEVPFAVVYYLNGTSKVFNFVRKEERMGTAKKTTITKKTTAKKSTKKSNVRVGR